MVEGRDTLLFDGFWTAVQTSSPCADGWIISEAHIAYGGVAPKTIMATRTKAALDGKPFTDATLQLALKAVAEDVNITPNAPGMQSLSVPARNRDH